MENNIYQYNKNELTVAIYTLGCKVNQYEAQEIVCLLKNNGYKIVSHKEKADIYIINSCTVTAESSRKSRQCISRFKSKNQNAIIIMTGCYSQAFSEEAKNIDDINILLGNNTNQFVAAAISKYLESNEKVIILSEHKKCDKYKGDKIDNFDGHTRAFIKIQDGCNRYCSYCIIPKARGFSRSRPLDDIKQELEALAHKGYKEVVFVGINLSAYGMDINKNICDALKLAQETNGIERIRLGSLEPDHLTDEIIDEMSKLSKFCPQFHLSLQSGCDKILKRMNRHYTSEEYFNLCKKLSATFSDISLTTDIIVGFPGESEADFNETIEFAKKCNFMKVHVFPFSPRKGTKAYLYDDKVTKEEQQKRCGYLTEICDNMRKDHLNNYINKTVNVLFESKRKGVQRGYTENYTPVCVDTDYSLCGQIKQVKILTTNGEFCEGILVK